MDKVQETSGSQTRFTLPQCYYVHRFVPFNAAVDINIMMILN
jgi:hypothetical protein